MSQQLSNIIARIIDVRRTQITITPSWVASEAYNEIDPGRRAPELVQIAAILQLRQLAREHCRGQFEDKHRDDEGPMFDFVALQWRYPTCKRAPVEGSKRSEPQYVLLEHMTDPDVAYNIERLTREGHAKLEHARALRAWWNERRSAA